MENLYEVKEGRVSVYIYRIDTNTKYYTAAPVFYNPNMRENRTISVAITSLYNRIFRGDTTYLDLFSATGIRGIRISKETDVGYIVVNDLSRKSVELIRKNIEKNNCENIEVKNEDANKLLVCDEKKYQFIDIDPFGSAAQFLSNIGKRITKKALISITSTDAPVLCGIYPKKALKNYHILLKKTYLCHEIGIRTLITSAILSLARDEFYGIPVYSHSTRHYFRIYIEAQKGSAKADNIYNHISLVSVCNKCGYFEKNSENPEHCGNCGSRSYLIGPLWTGPIKDSQLAEKVSDFVKITYPDEKACIKIAKTIADEADTFLYYDISFLSSYLRRSMPPFRNIIQTLEELGYTATRTHISNYGIKSNADYHEILEIICNSDKVK